jgi:transposase-like protein
MAEGDGRALATGAQAALLDDPEFLRGVVQDAVQAILEAEMAAHLGAGRYARTTGRTKLAAPGQEPTGMTRPLDFESLSLKHMA